MFADLMNAMLSGAGSQDDEQADGDQWANLLGGLMGGSAGQQGVDAGDLLAGLMGSSSSGGAAGFGGLLNAVIGGGSIDTGISSLLAPVTDQLSNKLGLPPETAQMIVTFVVSKLLSSRTSGGAAASRSGSAGEEGFDLDDLLAHVASDGRLDPGYLQSTGMVDELTEQSSLDSDTATQGLQEAFEILGGQFSAGQQP